MTLFGRYFWTSNYVNEQPKKFPTCHVRNISIYAPTRGATPIRDDLRQVQAISIHAPTRGATKQRWLKLFGGYISIHAPTRGATRNGSGQCLCRLYFNPRSYKRSDTVSVMNKLDEVLFQSTLLQEERHIDWEHYSSLYTFQSTLLQEERLQSSDISKWGCCISIHAPTRGATLFTRLYLF